MFIIYFDLSCDLSIAFSYNGDPTFHWSNSKKAPAALWASKCNQNDLLSLWAHTDSLLGDQAQNIHLEHGQKIEIITEKEK